jgi:uncharacterized protein
LSPELSQPVHLADPDRPFWGFAELLLIAALFIPAVGIGSLAVRAGSPYLHFDAAAGLALLAAEFIGYAIVFLALRLLFARYHEPLLKSLAWIPQPFNVLHLIVLGISLGLAMILLGSLMHFPNVETPFDNLLKDPASRIGISLFGLTLGPVVEELLFRGFLQPVLVDVMGVLPGILVTSILFGALHLSQNAFIWQSGVLITLVGFVLGVVRHVSGSTRASAITHISYNFLPFFLTLVLSGTHGSPK